MSKIRSKDTKPELRVRRALHARGFRYRLHRRDLPGNPDIVLARFQACIFVHGCFWHGHEGCPDATSPKTNEDYWRSKITRNRERDHESQTALKNIGWKVLVIWECETRTMEKLEKTMENVARKLFGNLKNPNS